MPPPPDFSVVLKLLDPSVADIPPELIDMLPNLVHSSAVGDAVAARSIFEQIAPFKDNDSVGDFLQKGLLGAENHGHHAVVRYLLSQGVPFFARLVCFAAQLKQYDDIEYFLTL